MKISKSKQELARIISENGGWIGGEFYVMCGDGTVLNSSNKPFYDARHGWCCGDGFGDNRFVSVLVAKNWCHTILSRAEYLHLFPVPDADGWIEWDGGNIPVGFGTLVDVKLRGGNVELCQQFTFSDSWNHYGGELDIIAYRLHKPVAEVKPTIEQLADDYRNKLAIATQAQEEADSHRCGVEVALSKLEIAAKELGFKIEPITAKQEPELVITDWRDLRVDDVIKCVGDAWDNEFEGREAVVIGIEGINYKYEHRIRARIGEESDWGGDFVFIRRP